MKRGPKKTQQLQQRFKTFLLEAIYNQFIMAGRQARGGREVCKKNGDVAKLFFASNKGGTTDHVRQSIS